MLNKLKIRQRILIIFLLVALSGSLLQLIVAGVQLQNVITEFHSQELEISALNLALSLSEPFEEYVDYDDISDIRNLVVRFQDTKTIEFIIFDKQLNPIFAEDENIIPNSSPSQSSETQVITERDMTGSERLYVMTPILYEGKTLGYVMTSEPTQNIMNDVTEGLSELIMATIAVAILVIMGSVWLANSISAPIHALEKSALEMAEGYLDTRIEIRSQDEVGQLANSFNYMAEQIDNLVKVQRSFVSNAAHELRTPLMSLSLRVEALQGDTLELEERQVYLTDLRQELDHMTQLVTSLLNLARIDEGRTTIEEPIEDISASLKDIARHWRIEAQRAGLVFEASVPNILPSVNISQNHLRLICDNLLGNAIKYTKEGSIKFNVSESEGQLRLIINDTGIGFTSEQAQNLFDRFYRSDVARANFQGTGLGLSITEALLNDYDGTIEASSSGFNQGATFTVTLPTKKS